MFVLKLLVFFIFTFAALGCTPSICHSKFGLQVIDVDRVENYVFSNISYVEISICNRNSKILQVPIYFVSGNREDVVLYVYCAPEEKSLARLVLIRNENKVFSYLINNRSSVPPLDNIYTHSAYAFNVANNLETGIPYVVKQKDGCHEGSRQLGVYQADTKLVSIIVGPGNVYLPSDTSREGGEKGTVPF